MKKILIGILIILLVVMAYFAVFSGISIGNFKVLGVTQIQEENDKLEQQIAQTEILQHSTYASQTEQLEKSVSNLLTAKEEYKELETVSTEGEIKEATKQETYKIEYLWTRIGSHATAEGVILKLDVQTGDTGESDIKNLSFTVTGNYIAIINFITSIEDDSELGFRIENFKILPGTDTNGREATFIVRNVKIKQENITSNVTTGQAQENNNANTGNTNKENTNKESTNTENTNKESTNTENTNKENTNTVNTTNNNTANTVETTDTGTKTNETTGQ